MMFEENIIQENEDACGRSDKVQGLQLSAQK